MLVVISVKWSVDLSAIIRVCTNNVKENVMNVLNALNAIVLFGVTLLPAPGLADAPPNREMK